MAAANHVVTESPAANGTAVVRPLGPQIQRRDAWLDLPQDEYPGFRVKVWVNYPRRLATEIGSGDEARMRAALLEIVTEHNGWCDYDGQPYPPATDPAFWTAIPDELAAVAIVSIREAAGLLPKSLAANWGR